MPTLYPRMTMLDFSAWLRTLNKADRQHAQRLYNAAINPDNSMMVNAPRELLGTQPITEESLHLIYSLMTSDK